MSSDRLPPHNTDAEEAVLGSIFVDHEAIATVASWLSPDDFYEERNKWAYDACLSLYERNEAINQITVAEELLRKGRLDGVGGNAYLSHIVSILPTSVHIEDYGQIVSRLGLMRRLISGAGQIAAMAYEAGPDAEAVLDKAEDILFRLRHGEGSRDFVHIRRVLGEYFEEGELDLPSQQGRPINLFSGFEALDQLLGGLQRSDMIVVAARPSLGKSSLALSVARNAAVNQGAHVAVFSLEMDKEQVMQRILSAESGMDSKRIRMRRYTDSEWETIIGASGTLSEAPIYIDDSPAPKIVEMRSKVRRLQYDHGVDLVIIDYMQLVRGSSRSENRVQELSEISRSIKVLARELNVPIIAVSQLSRAVEQRTPHIPMLSDLRESGSIEQDADIVIFIYRDDVYSSREDWEKRNPDRDYPEGIANIIIAKHRNGPTGQVDLRFTRSTAKFDNLEREESGIEQQTFPRVSI